MRVAAVDYGTRRLGVAIGEDGRVVAARTLSVHSQDQAYEALAALVRNESVETVVFGLPLRLDGTEREEARRIREFAVGLSKLVRVPVVFVDERLTTKEAALRLAEQGLSRQQARKLLDREVATILLEQYFREQDR